MKKNKNVKDINIPKTEVDFFESIGNKGVYIALSLLVVVAFLVFKDFILLKKVYLYRDIGSDTLNGAYPFFYNFAKYSNKYGLPTWSFQEGMGQNIVGGFLRDPFMVIAYMVGASAMPKIYVFIELIKIISGGVVFYLFLKQLKISNFSATIGALLFSFSGFMIIGSCWYVFTYEAFTIALTLLGFELYFQKNKWFLFIIAIFSIAVSMPFNLYVTGIILLFYIIFRLGQTGQLKFKPFIVLIGKLMALGVIGLLISAPFLFEASLQLIESPRGSGTTSYFNILASKPMFAVIDKFQFGTFITRLFSSDLTGSGSNFKGWGNFLEAPVSYSGILSIILMPQIFTSVSKSTRKFYIIWLLVWLLPTLFPYFRYAFWLFTGDYYRVFSFCLSMVFIIYSVIALDLILKNKKINLITLIVTIVVSIILLKFNYFKGMSVKLDTGISLFIYTSIILYGGVLFFISKPNASPYLKYVLLTFVCIEMAFLSSFTINRRDAVYTKQLTEKIGYNDYSVEAVDYIKKNEKGFYRIDKNYYSSGAIHGSLNDNKILDYYGTSSYSSFANNNFINYLREYGIISKENENETRWAQGLISRPILESLNNVKYIMIKGYTNPIWRYTHDSVAKFGDVIILKSKFSLPFGYTYNQFIKQSDFDKLTLNQKDIVSLKAFVLKDEDIQKVPEIKSYPISDTIANSNFSFDSYKAEISKLAKNALELSSFSDKKITGNITSDVPEMMYLSFPFDKGWHLNIDGKEAETIYLNNGMTGIYLTNGKHEIELNYKLRVFNIGLLLIPLGIILIILLLILDRKNKNILKFNSYL